MRTVTGKSKREELLLTLLLSSGVSAFLLGARLAATGSLRFWFLIWNLFLAWIPLGIVFLLRINLKKKPWRDWQNIGLTIAWLAFLPNSFYIISDLIHIQSSGEVGLLYDVALVTSFVLNGLLLGYCSLFVMHRMLLVRMKASEAHIIVGLVLLLSSFAIYLGRFLRWNSWDIILSPAGLLFDVSDRFINPADHQQTYIVTGVFFILLSSVYAVIYNLVRIISSDSQDKA